MAWRYAKRAILGLSLLLLVAVAAGFAAVQSHGGKLLSVQTHSMTPAIKKGDLVVVTRVPDRALKVGDVVTYVNPRNPKQTITHRIVALPSIETSKRFIVKGDANPAADQPVRPTSIIGKVTYHQAYLGYGVDLVR